MSGQKGKVKGGGKCLWVNIHKESLGLSLEVLGEKPGKLWGMHIMR